MCVLINRRAEASEAKKMADFFCAAANESGHIRFSYSYRGGKACLVLKGGDKELSEIMEKFYNCR